MTNPASIEGVEQRLAGLLVEDKDQHVYRLHRSAFTDAELFDLEMKHIFEGNWIYLAHESQIPNVNDYFTTQIGRQPIVITRSIDDDDLKRHIEVEDHILRTREVPDPYYGGEEGFEQVLALNQALDT